MTQDIGRSVPDGLSPSVEPAARLDGSAASIPSAIVREACDILAERAFGNPARSPGHNARVILETALREERALWQPISSAPKDQPILAYCSSDCRSEECGFHSGKGTSLCLYHGHAEGLTAFGDGLCIVEWGGSWDDSTWEYPNAGWMPDWWFRVGSEFEEAANPIFWMPLPPVPAQAIEARRAATTGAVADESAVLEEDASND